MDLYCIGVLFVYVYATAEATAAEGKTVGVSGG